MGLGVGLNGDTKTLRDSSRAFIFLLLFFCSFHTDSRRSRGREAGSGRIKHSCPETAKTVRAWRNAPWHVVPRRQKNRLPRTGNGDIPPSMFIARARARPVRRGVNQKCLG